MPDAQMEGDAAAQPVSAMVQAAAQGLACKFCWVQGPSSAGVQNAREGIL